MLLRASRSADALTKGAFVLPLARKAAGGLAKRLFSKRGLMLAGGTALTGAVAAPMVMQGMQKSQVGLSSPYIQAQKHGLVPQMRAG